MAVRRGRKAQQFGAAMLQEQKGNDDANDAECLGQVFAQAICIHKERTPGFVVPEKCKTGFVVPDASRAALYRGCPMSCGMAADAQSKYVDARHKPGHDGDKSAQSYSLFP